MTNKQYCCNGEIHCRETSPYSEVWLHEEDKIKHDKSVIIRREAIKNGKEKSKKM